MIQNPREKEHTKTLGSNTCLHVGEQQSEQLVKI